jgi:ATP-dependent helicase HrpB
VHVSLPIDSYLEEISGKLKDQSRLVLSAEAGAGKSTRVPWFLAKTRTKKTLVLQPRRVAALMLAERVAQETQTELGKEVGYHIRYDRKTSPQTRLIYITEAMLKKYIQRDPFLEDTDLVILDEFHERSIHSDIALMMLQRLQRELRPDLEILVMSATMDSKKVSRYLGDCPIVEVPGRSFPVECFYEGSKIEDPRNLNEITQKLKPALQKALAHNAKEDILVFLPGAREIRHCQLSIQEDFPNLKVFPLHASLPAHEIRKALSTTPYQKLILATNIAETSLTLPNLGTVIDTGLVRESSISLPHLVPQLRTSRISQASSEQRKGRAGRIQKGRCYRLWAIHDQKFLEPYDTPEIFRSDLSEELPYLYDVGFEGHPINFPWFEKPPERLLQVCVEKLQSLEILNNSFSLQAGSSDILNSPLSLRPAIFIHHLIRLSPQCPQPLGSQALLWAAGLEEIPIATREGDFENAVETQKQYILESRIYRRLLDHYSAFIDLKAQTPRDQLLIAFLKAHKDRICRFRNFSEEASSKREFLIMNGGRGVKVDRLDSKFRTHEFLVALDLRDSEHQNKDSLCSFYLPITKDDLLRLLPNHLRIKKWTEESPQGLKFFEAKYLDQLPLEEARPSSSDKTLLKRYILSKALSDWKTFIQLNTELSQLWQRFRFYAHFMDQKSFEEIPTLEYLENIAEPFQSLEELASLPQLKDLLRSRLDYKELQVFEKLLPSRITTPNGRLKEIFYKDDFSAMLSLRLQDAFGWRQHPTLCNGKIRLRLELLSPAGRPIQITEDILGFWKGSYTAIRKEMRARYPKHKWPEDPLEKGEES